MDRELYVLRHSKSAWGGNDVGDHERPLNSRGQQDAQQLAVWLKKKYLYPGLVICSTALRARQTLAPIIDTLELDSSKILYEERLYLASRGDLLKVLGDVTAEQGSVMLVGHNPGLDDLVNFVSRDEPPLTENGKLMTTTCLAQFKMPQDWHNLQQRGELVSLTRPGDIKN